MPSCEICGKRNDSLKRALVEGVIVDVCDNCGKFGKVIDAKKPSAENERRIALKNKIPEEIIINNYHEIIKKARERKGMRQEELAKNISEKESIIHKIETGSMKPSIILAKKLEQFFNIKLIEINQEEKGIGLSFKNNEMTIGDLLKVQKRKV